MVSKDKGGDDWFRKVLAVMIVVAAAVMTGLLTLLPVAAQEKELSATRSFDAATVAPGGEVEVTVAVANYGGFGEVTETLPAGFAYVSSPKSDQVEATGQTVRLTLQGDTSIAYTVTASDTAGLHAFSGTLRDSDRNNHDVGGATGVTVAAAPTGPVPSATRSFDAATVAPGGGSGSDHRRRQLRGVRRSHRDAARGVRLRVQPRE